MSESFTVYSTAQLISASSGRGVVISCGGGGTLFYGSTPAATDASLAPGQSVTRTTPTYVRSASSTMVWVALRGNPSIDDGSVTSVDLADTVGGAGFDVTDYGAVGNGTVNDTSAIQAAIVAAAVKGGTVYFPPGTYSVSSTITLYSGVTLQGAGRVTTTIKLASGSNTTVFKSENFDTLTGTLVHAWDGVSRLTIQDLTLDGNKANNASGVNGFSLFGFNILFERVHVHDCKVDGIYCEGPVWAAIEGETDEAGFIDRFKQIDVHSCGRDGLRMYGPNDSQMTDSILWVNASANLRVSGIAGKSAAPAFQMVNCHIYSGLTSTTVAGDYGLWANVPVYATGCEFESAGIAAVYLDGETSVGFQGASSSKFANCGFFSCPIAGGAGTWLNGTTATLTGCQFSNCWWVNNKISIKLTGTNTQHNVRGLVVTAVGDTSTSGTWGTTNNVMLHVTGSGTNAPLVQFGTSVGSFEHYGNYIGSGLASTGQVYIGNVSADGVPRVIFGSTIAELAGTTDLVNAGPGLKLTGTAGKGFVQLGEQSSDPAALADTGKLFTKDNGSGKTQLCVRFGSGAVQVIATEP